MARTRGKSGSSGIGLFGRGAGIPRSAGYLVLSTRPLHIMIFLLPFLALYELGSIMYLRHPAEGVQESIAAYGILDEFFKAFGVASFHIPSVLLLVILSIWHILEKDPLSIRWSVFLRMFAESVIWTMPLLVFGLLIQSQRPYLGGPPPNGGLTIAALSWQAKLTLSAGAGVYEELLFRLVIIMGVHFVVSDIFHGSKGVGFTLGAFISAIAFALYHNIDHPGGGVDLKLLGYFTAAGLYFAALFVFRGFGIAAAAHFLYDAVVLVVIPATRH
jgi:hypothetical protein